MHHEEFSPDTPLQGLNSIFEVYLVGNNSNHFIISPTSIQGKADIRIRVAVPLDFETISRYEFALFANESVPDHVGFARVKINLINENDNRPIFSQVLYNISLFENVTVGTTVLKVLNIWYNVQAVQKGMPEKSVSFNLLVILRHPQVR
ncbi:UNVERIFIED_CONTAM: Cadherin-23 [Gekko kuhli]